MEKLLPRYDSLDLGGANDAASTARNTGNTAINSYDPTQAGKDSTGAVTGNFNIAQGQNAQAVNPLQSVINSNPKVTDLYNTGNEMFNVPALKTTATNLNNAVTNALPAGYGGARGFDINNTQIENGAAQKTAYLTPQANAATANANTAEGLASNFVNAGIAQNAQNLIPAQENATLTGQNLATEGAGWNAAQAATLQGLIDKMNAGITLSGTEMQMAQTLAQQEEAYQQQQSANATAIQEAKIKNQYQIVPSGNNLFNTFANTAINPGIATSKSKQGVATYG